MTRNAFIASSLLSVPLLASYNFVGVILYRDLGGSALQVMVLTMLRPLVALLALYWSFWVAGRADRLMSNLIWSGLLARLPFFLCPFIHSPWMFIAIAAFYMLLSRGGVPAWMEVFRRNLPKNEHGRVFSNGASWGYVEGVILAIGIGTFLDGDHDAWRWIFPASAIIGVLGVYFQAKIPIKATMLPIVPETSRRSLREMVTAPWKNAIQLMRERPDFRRFQWGFMVCGAGMMVIQPALPLYFVDVLGITYTELAIALTICKGLGFAVTSPLWARWWRHTDVYLFSSLIFGAVALFPLLLMLAPVYRPCLYMGYLIYGIGQAGSEMCWHLSGSVFSKQGDSSMFTGVNVAMVGVRGAVIPPIGSLVCIWAGPVWVFGAAIALCLASAVIMFRANMRSRSSTPELVLASSEVA